MFLRYTCNTLRNPTPLLQILIQICLHLICNTRVWALASISTITTRVAEPWRFDGSGSYGSTAPAPTINNYLQTLFCEQNFKILWGFVCIILGRSWSRRSGYDSCSDLTKRCFGSGSATLITTLSAQVYVVGSSGITQELDDVGIQYLPIGVSNQKLVVLIIRITGM